MSVRRVIVIMLFILSVPADIVSMGVPLGEVPGFGGQKFIPGSLGKIGQAAALIRETGRDIRLQVDGGVDAGNVREIVEAGADVIVAGNSIF